MKRHVSREYTLGEDEIREALILFFKARDVPLPSQDEPLSIRNCDGQDITMIEIRWSTRDEV
jgi:hypothetical protein